MKLKVFLVALGLAGLAGGAWAKGPKYVFVFIGDGMSMPQRMVADEFARASGHGPLAMNTLAYQCTTRTCSANAIITDSAAAATAIACGEKTNNGYVGVTPDGRRLESVAEFAHRTGRRVGIMTTVTIVHATPAGFYAHRKSRGLSYQIALDLIASGFEFFAGAGVYHKFNDITDPCYQGNVFDLAAQAGYRIIRDRAGFLAARNGDKCWAHFNDSALPYAIDGYGTCPSPAEMTAKAISVLDNPRGFFIMCEGGKVDYAAHANDAATMLREILATDAAVKVALDFQKERPDETLILTTGDHETGGLSMGFAGTGGRFLIERLAAQKVSVEAFSGEIKKMLKADPGIAFVRVKPAVTEKFGLVFPATEEEKKLPLAVTAEEAKELEKAFEADRASVRRRMADTTAHDVARKYVFAAACKRVLAAKAGVGWSSGSHTALPTLTTAQGPGAERFVGMLENCDIARKLREILKD